MNSREIVLGGWEGRLGETSKVLQKNINLQPQLPDNFVLLNIIKILQSKFKNSASL